MTKMRNLLIMTLTSFVVTACVTQSGPPTCREATGYEKSVFGAIMAHDEAQLSQLMKPGPISDRVRRLDQAVEHQIFGYSMGDRSVRTIIMQPPLCVYDQSLTKTTKVSYVFPNGRFQQLQAPKTGLNLGVAGRDHVVCKFENVNGAWQLIDGCTQTFKPDLIPAKS